MLSPAPGIARRRVRTGLSRSLRTGLAGLAALAVAVLGVPSAAATPTALLPTSSLGTAPLGSIDSATGGLGSVQVRGWAFDPQTTASSYVWVEVAGKGQLVRASGQRPDVAAYFPTMGSAHGFDVTLPAPGGNQRVCATAVDIGGGPNTLLGCRMVTVRDSSPVGRIEALTANATGVTVSGWALDPDTSTSTYLWVDIDGANGHNVLANGNRPDIGAAFPGAGNAHGFTNTMNAGPGSHRVCVTAVNIGAGANKSLGCATANVPWPAGSPSSTYGGGTALVSGPHAGNTGVPAGKTLRVHRGDLVITTPGTVIDGLDIYGFVTIKAANVTIKNSRVRGSGPGSYNTGLINVTHSAVKNALIQDVTLVPDHPSVWINGVLGHDFIARRVNTYNVVDGFGIFNTHAPTANVVVERSYVHDLAYFSPDPNHSDNKTHNDAIQIQGGSNIHILNNHLSAYLSKTAGTQNYTVPQAGFGVILTPNVSKVSGSRINGNWFFGSYIPVKLTTGNKGPMAFGEVNSNRFGRDMRNVGYAGKSNYFTVLMTPDTSAYANGNVYDDNNAPVTVRRDSGTATAP